MGEAHVCGEGTQQEVGHVGRHGFAVQGAGALLRGRSRPRGLEELVQVTEDLHAPAKP